MNNNKTQNNKNLNESLEILLIPIAFVFIINFVLKTILIILQNYIIPESSNNYKYSKKYSDIIKKISNYDVQVYIVNTDIKNAWNIGANKLFITKPLLKLLNEKEIIAILLHECGHYANYDVQKQVYFIEPLSKLLILYILLGMFIAFPFLATLKLLLVIDLFISPSILRLLKKHLHGRKAEFLADSFASEYGYSGALASALEKLEKEFKKDFCKTYANSTECQLAIKQLQFFDEHPTLFERKINIKSKNLKYTNILLSDNKSDKKLVRKSYFEVRAALQELKEEIKEHIANEKLKKLEYIKNKKMNKDTK